MSSSFDQVIPTSDNEEEDEMPYTDLSNTINVVNENNEIIAKVFTSSPVLTTEQQQKQQQEEELLTNPYQDSTLPTVLLNTSQDISPNDDNDLYQGTSSSDEDNVSMLSDGDNYIVMNDLTLPDYPEIPIMNYNRDTEDMEDYANDWLWLNRDTGASCGPFIGTPSLLMTRTSRKPEDFFSALFDDHMWTTIADETNRYARQRMHQQRGIKLNMFIMISNLVIKIITYTVVGTGKS